MKLPTINLRISTFLVFVFSFFVSPHLGAQIPNFFDPNLTDCVQEQADIHGWVNAGDISSLNCDGRGIQDIAGIEVLGGLSALSVKNNSIEDIYPLSMLGSLIELEVSGNPIVDLFGLRMAIEANKDISKLALASIEFNDASDLVFNDPVSGTPLNITWLDVSDTGITELSFINSYPDLGTLLAAENSTADIIDISGLSNLAELDLSYNKLQYLGDLITHTNLLSLDLSGNPKLMLPELFSVIQNNSQLQSLGLNGLPIDDLNQLPQDLRFSLLELNIGNTNITDLDPLNDYPELQVLNISGLGLGDLFYISGMWSLRSLDVSNNNLKDLMPISGLTQLEHLWLSGNSRIDFDQLTSVLAANPEIKELGLGSIKINDLNELPLSDPNTGEPYALTMLDLSYTGIQNVFPLEQFPSLRSLNLAGNNISDFPAFSFDNSLEELDLSYNSLTYAEDLILFSRLRKLNLSGNIGINFDSLLPILMGNPNIQELGLGSIKIKDPNQLILNKPNGQPYKLKTLDVSNIGLSGSSYPDLQFLNSYPFLENLDISDNGLSDLGGILVLGMENKLRELDLSGNNLRYPGDFVQLTNLEKLDLSGNGRMMHPEYSLLIENNPGLRSLGLNGIAIEGVTQLPFLNSQPGESFSFEELDIGNTGLDDIHWLNTFPELKSVNISGNGIDDLMPLNVLTDLISLDASNNKLTNLGSIIDLKSLERLNLSNNPGLDVQDVSYVISQNQNLKELQLSGVVIGDLNILPLLDPYNGEVFSLEVLDVSNSGIQNIDMLGQFENLRSLNLAGNKVDNFFPLSNLIHLEELDLSNTRIEVAHGLFNLFKLKKLNVSGNSQLDFYEIRGIIEGNQNLQDLGLASIAIDDTSSLLFTRQSNGMPYNLTSLNLSDTGIDNLDFINNYPLLKKLNLSANGLEDLFGISAVWVYENNLIELDLSDNKLRYLDQMYSLTNLKKLNLSGNSQFVYPELEMVLAANTQLRSLGINGIKVDDFYQLPLFNQQELEPYSLVELDIGNTGISDLLRLQEFPGLQSLNISGNALEDFLPVEALHNLRSLDASDNRIFDILPLMNHEGLQRLVLSGNSGIDVNDLNPVLSKNPALRELGLADIAIVSLTQLILHDMYSGVPYPIGKLDLSNTGITDISVLAQFEQLRVLNIGDNNIYDIQWLSALNFLEDLDLGNNRIEFIDGLTGLSNLKKLNVGGNSHIDFNMLYQVLINNQDLQELGLASITIEDSNMLQLNKFNGTPYDLRALDISNTGVHDLSFIGAYPYLEVLDLSHNGIVDLYFLDQLFFDNRLLELDVSYNDILFSGNVHMLTQLEKLDLSGNSEIMQYDVQMLIENNPDIESIGLNGIYIGDLNQLPLMNMQTAQPYNLKELDIGNTGITNIYGLTDFPGLQALNISGNGITDLMPLAYMDQLKSLDVSNNSIFDVNPLNGLFSLERLWLSGNSGIIFSDILPIIDQNTGLRELGLGGIYLGDLNSLPLHNPHTGQPYSLKTLDISNTGIFDIGMLDQFPGLRSLDASGNSISDVNALTLLNNLEVLDLSDNQLQNIDPLNLLANLRQLNLSGNSDLDFNLIFPILLNNYSLQELGLGSIAIQDSSQLVLYKMDMQPYDLKVLDLSNTGINDLVFLDSYPTLKVLDLSDNDLVSVGNLTNLLEPELIDLSGNNNILCDDLDFITSYFSPEVLVIPSSCSNGAVPTIEILSPVSGGEFMAYELLTLHAFADDQEDGDISENIVWASSISGEINTGAYFDLQSFVVGEHLITATITDSDGNEESASISVNISPALPELTIVSPQNGLQVNAADLVTFEATAHDFEDGDMSASIVWVSSITGELGMGASYSVHLEAGAHQIEAVIIDSDGHESVEIISVTVAPALPELTIVSPQNGLQVNAADLVTFEATAHDFEDGDMSASIVWVSSITGELGMGASYSVHLEAGAHQIEAVIIDSDGHESVEIISVTVAPAVPELTIVSPQNGWQVNAADLVTFEATAHDFEDGDMSASIVWVSSITGELGMGASHSVHLEAGAHQIEAVIIDSDGHESIEIISVTVAPAVPELTIVSPQSGLQVNAADLVTFEATAHDFEDGDMSASIVWVSSITGELGMGASYSVHLEAGAHQIEAVIIDSDGHESIEIISVTVAPAVPELTIVSPQSGLQVNAADLVTFEATAHDFEDGDMSASIVWVSSITGELGMGASYSVHLEAGAHQIEAVIIDSDGHESIEIISVTVAPAVPELTNVSPQSGLQVNAADLVTFEATAHDFEEGDMSAQIVWTSSIMGPLATGAVFDMHLVAGDHVITASVIDSHGHEASVATTVSVSPAVPEIVLAAPLGGTIANAAELVPFQASAHDFEEGDMSAQIVWTSNIMGPLASGAVFDMHLVAGDHVITASVIDSHGHEASVATTVSVSPAVPEIVLAAPLEGTIANAAELVPFQASAHDFEEGDMSAQIVWTSSIMGPLATGAVFDMHLVAGDHVITASVIDSHGHEASVATTVSVSPAVPAISISSPLNGSSFNAADLVSFGASALDFEDGDISEQIIWTSSITGSLGAGAAFDLNLIAGEHVITASVTDNDGHEGVASVSLTILEPMLEYCDSSGNNSSYEWINEVILGGEANTSGDDSGYGDYTDLNDYNLNYGANAFVLVPGFSGRSYREAWSIWVDLNQNGEFEDAELLHTSDSKTTIYGDIQIPDGALGGATRMRISMQWRNSPPACGNFSWGEVEDYTVTIQ